MPVFTPPTISNQEELQKAIAQLKGHLASQEKDLGERAAKIPQQLFKKASGAIVPAVLTTASLAGAWNILKLVPVAQSLFSIFKKKKD